MMSNARFSRRTVLALVGGAGAVTLTGCFADEHTEARHPLPDPLVVRLDDAGVALVRDDLGPAPYSIASRDGRSFFDAAPGETSTRIWQVDTAAGVDLQPVELTGAWYPQVVAENGAALALVAGRSAYPAGKPPARTSTKIAWVDANHNPHTMTLDGNIVPEAFTSDNTGLFYLEWMPANAPESYRVRMVDLTSGVAGPLLTRNKQPVPAGDEEKMRGDGRQAVLNPNRVILYTLYTHQPDHQHTRDLIAARPGSGAHAFIHTLHLEQRWAYCIDLPEPFGEAPAETHAMAAAPDGVRVWVADLAAGALAEVAAGVDDLSVMRVHPAPQLAGAAHIAVSSTTIYLAAGKRLVSMPISALATVTELSPDGEVNGLTLSPDGQRLYVGQPGKVVTLDAATGKRIAEVSVPGMVELRGLGR